MLKCSCIIVVCSFGLVKSYNLSRPVESASLEPFKGKFIAGGDDMWVRLFDFHNGEEIGKWSYFSKKGLFSLEIGIHVCLKVPCLYRVQ